MYVLKERTIPSSTRFFQNQFSNSECLPVCSLRFLNVGWEKSKGKHRQRKRKLDVKKVLTTGVHFGEHGISDPPGLPIWTEVNFEHLYITCPPFRWASCVLLLHTSWSLTPTAEPTAKHALFAAITFCSILSQWLSK